MKLSREWFGWALRGTLRSPLLSCTALEVRPHLLSSCLISSLQSSYAGSYAWREAEVCNLDAREHWPSKEVITSLHSPSNWPVKITAEGWTSISKQLTGKKECNGMSPSSQMHLT